MPISHRHRPNEYPDYVSPLPAEELIKMGTVKQDMYSAGVQQTQSYMDEMAKLGVDLAKDPDKEYFTSELEKLTSSINQSARGVDFSNLQQVRSLMNVGKPLENDITVINGINGTKELRRRQEEISNMPPNMRSASNDWYHMKTAAEWLNDGKAGSKLGYQEYTPYVDINAKLADVISKLKAEKFTLPPQFDSGHITITDVERLTDKRIQDVILSELDGKEQGQLMIDASYELHNMGPKAAQVTAINGTTKRLKATDEAIVSLGQQRAQIAKAYSDATNPQNKLELKTKLDELDEEFREQTQAKKKFETEIQSYNDPKTMDISKYYPFYFREYITNKSSGWAYQNTDTKIQNDTLYEKAIQHGYTMSEIAARNEGDMSIAKYKAKHGDGTSQNNDKHMSKLVYTDANFEKSVLPNLKIESDGSATIQKWFRNSTVEEALKNFGDKTGDGARAKFFKGSTPEQLQAANDAFFNNIIKPLREIDIKDPEHDQISIELKGAEGQTIIKKVFYKDFLNSSAENIFNVRAISTGQVE